MREKAADVLRERDALRRQNDILAEALRVSTSREYRSCHVESRAYNDATCGAARMDATLINPTRAHGGICLVETYYHGERRRDVEAILLDDWRIRVRRIVESGGSSAWLMAELDICEAMAREQSRANERVA